MCLLTLLFFLEIPLEMLVECFLLSTLVGESILVICLYQDYEVSIQGRGTLVNLSVH